MQKFYASMSYEQVVRKYAQAVTAACLVRLRNPSDAEDCFQNTFLKLYTSAPDFNDEQHLKAWLLRVAINESKNILRTLSRTVPLDAAADVAVFLPDDGDGRVLSALRQLKPKYREAVWLHYCEGYKVEEIAGILGKNTNTVKTLLRRGREQFKELYGGDTDE